MIGALIVTHGNLGSEMLKAAEMIKGEVKSCIPLSIDQTKSVEEINKDVMSAIKKLDRGQGVLILTDLFGGTPSNISLSYLKEGRVDVITGVNLPMLLKFFDLREKMTIKELAISIADYGRKNIYLASEILTKKVSG
ncbi:MAG: PTS sugar transporter subunit IIA [Smithellaceae bacterium]|nr:PTS sugar transporter subunit IIA [Smithellaceae bacterium]